MGKNSIKQILHSKHWDFNYINASNGIIVHSAITEITNPCGNF